MATHPTTTISRGTVIDIGRKLVEAVIHGADTSFLIDLPYNTYPQAAKQDAENHHSGSRLHPTE